MSCIPSVYAGFCHSSNHITKTLTDRLAQLDAQRELAYSTDSADQGNSPQWVQADEG
ncbi:hypothetical protein ABZ942_28005 [Nocardia sp. NPDC046473]|uniref:hypothetical protein n=1 Tax=Nocardia sp. NPDC046473 TaxID=3155733 RepID=UPI0033FD0AAD